MKAFLQGRWLGDPLHPLLVHFPVAFIPGAVLFDILSLATGNNTWVKAATIALLVGVIGAVLAAIAGAAEWVDIPATAPRTRATANTHAIVNLIAAALAVVSLILHAVRWDDPKVSVLAFVFVLVSFLLVAFSGYLGGKLVYDHHLGVGRNESTGHPYLREGAQPMSEGGRRDVPGGQRSAAINR